jgi:hypothetical protein
MDKIEAGVDELEQSARFSLDQLFLQPAQERNRQRLTIRSGMRQQVLQLNAFQSRAQFRQRFGRDIEPSGNGDVFSSC